MRDAVPRHQDQRSRGGQGPSRLLLRVPVTQAARGGEAAVQVTVAAAGEGRPEAAVVPCQSAAVAGAIGSEPAADVS